MAVSRYATTMQPTKIWLQPGWTMGTQDLLYATLLRSASLVADIDLAATATPRAIVLDPTAELLFEGDTLEAGATITLIVGGMLVTGHVIGSERYMAGHALTRDFFQLDADAGDDEAWERLEEALLRADVGVRATAELVRRLEARQDLDIIVAMARRLVRRQCHRRCAAAADPQGETAFTAADKLDIWTSPKTLALFRLGLLSGVG